jgi:hypothetical protein
MRSFAKRLTIVVGALLGLFAVALGGLVLFLQSEAGAHFVLGKATAAARKAGWALRAGEMSLRVFRGLRLRDFELTCDGNRLTLGELDVAYRLGVFPLRLDVERFLASGIRLHWHGKAKPVAPAPTSIGGAGLDSARQWLEKPPSILVVRRFAVSDVEFDFVQEDRTGGGVAARGSIEALEGTLVAEPGRFGLDGELRRFVAPLLSLASASFSGKGAARFEGKFRVLAAKAGGRWSERVEIRNVAFSASGFEGRYGQTGSPWQLRRLAVAVDGESAIGGPEPLSLDRLVVEVLSGSATVEAKDWCVGEKGKPLFATPTMSLVASGQRANDVRIEANGTLGRATVSGVKGPVKTDVTATVTAPLDFRSLEARVRGKVDGVPVAEGGLTATAGNPAKLESWGTLLLKAPFTRRVPAMAALAGSAGLRGRIDWNGTVRANMVHVLDAPKWANASIDTAFRGELVPVGQRDRKLSAGRLSTVGTLRRDAGLWKLESKVETDRLLAGKADLPHSVVDVRGEYGPDGTGSFVLTAGFEGDSFFEARATLEKNGTARGEAKATVTPVLARRLGANVGRWALRSSFALRPEGAARAIEAAGEVVQQDATRSPLGPVRLAGPATWTFRGTYAPDGRAVEGIFESLLPAVDVEALGRLGALRARATFDARGKTDAHDANVHITAQQESLWFRADVAPGLPVLGGAHLELRAMVRGGTRFTLDKLEASVADGLLSVTGTAAGRIDRGSYQMGLKLAAEIPTTFPAVKGMRVSGRAEVPLTINVGGGRDIAVDGDLVLTNGSWANRDIALSGISGRVPLQYQLVRDGRGIRFAYLTTQNPFERVDYERLRPLLARAEQIRIGEVRFSDRRYGPVVGVFSMRQNLLLAHTFDVSFGSSGSLGGEFFADVNPDNLRVGLLSRLTALNLTEVLPSRSLVRVPTGRHTVSGRCGIVVDVRSGVASGRFDITEIGATQLVTLINAMDPSFENEKLNLARTALSLGYPTFVSARFERGYMDLAIDLRVVGTHQHFDVRGVPLSTFLASAFANARSTFSMERTQ